MEWLTGKSISSLVAILLLALLAKKAETILKNSKKIHFLHFHTERYSPYVSEEDPSFSPKCSVVILKNAIFNLP